MRPVSLSTKATATTPPPANSPNIHTMLVRDDPNVLFKTQKINETVYKHSLLTELSWL